MKNKLIDIKIIPLEIIINSKSRIILKLNWRPISFDEINKIIPPTIICPKPSC